MKREENLLAQLIEYGKSDYYGFHMPGHKRNSKLLGLELPYAIDITEIEKFDDLHHAEGILLESKLKAANVFGADESFYLINGSTAGNLAAIMAITNPGDKILIARNNHKSVYNAVYMNRLEPIYIYPKYDATYDINGEILPHDVEKVLSSEAGIKAVVIVSPTYEGIISDVRAIAEIVHSYGAVLIVDEAHGAHLGMHDYFPKNSNSLGADIVVHSVHKTLPSLTQTGLLHINGLDVDREKIQCYLKMLQSSSPSYVLMASIDRCVNMVEKDGKELFKKYTTMLASCRERLKKLNRLKLVEIEIYDRSKIVISTKDCGLTGRELYYKLYSEYHLQLEMCSTNYVVAMTSIGDSEEGFFRLTSALTKIDEEVKTAGYERKNNNSECGEDRSEEKDRVLEGITENMFPRLRHAQGNEIGSEWFYYVYPPGIPIVAKGEVITEEVEQLIKVYEKAGFVIQKG
ncbi:MAG: aminotransferase class I/II-fold pyridoxal phosphate-dependent enzyme [Eubacteriales bacterium]